MVVLGMLGRRSGRARPRCARGRRRRTGRGRRGRRRPRDRPARRRARWRTARGWRRSAGRPGWRPPAQQPVLGRRRRRSAGSSVASWSPASTQASAAIDALPPLLPTTATLGPVGTGWWLATSAASSSAAMVGTRTTPVWRSRASTVSSSSQPSASIVECAARAHGEHRLLGRHPADVAAEAAGVAERLEVEQHDVGAVVVEPVLEQVVARQVGLVAHGHEVRDAQAHLAGPLEDDRTDRARLRQQPDPPGDAGRSRRTWRAVGRRGRC